MNEEFKGTTEAESLLEDLGFDSLPIRPDNVAKEITTDDFDLIFESQPFRSSRILGKAIGNDRGAVVYINSMIPDPRRFNFTAAHELGHVCMHIMPNQVLEFECGSKELSNSYNDPLEQQANGFASGMLMPAKLINPITDGELNWLNVKEVSNQCDTSLEATIRRLFKLNRDPFALVIHKDSKFERFVPSDSFAPFIPRGLLSADQMELCSDGLDGELTSEFDLVDAEDWVNPYIKGGSLQRIYSSSISLEREYVYTLLKYDDDCF